MQRNFDNLYGEIKKTTADVGAHEKFVKWTTYSAVASLLGRKVWTKPFNSIIMHPNMFVCLVGDQHSSRVLSIVDKIYGMVKDTNLVAFLPTTTTSHAILRDLMDIQMRRTFIYDGFKYQTADACMLSTEASQLLTRQVFSIFNVMSDLYESKPEGWHKERGLEKSNIRHCRFVINNVCVNAMFCGTTDWFVREMYSRALTESLPSKFVFVMPSFVPDVIPRWSESEEIDQHHKEKIIEDFKKIGSIIGEFVPTMEFKRAFDNKNDSHTRYMFDKRENKLASIISNKPTNALKLSMVISALESDERILKAEHFEQAWNDLSALEDDLQIKAETTSSSHDLSFVADKIFYFLKRSSPKHYTKQQLKVLFTLKDRKLVDGAVTKLVELERIKINESLLSKGVFYYYDESIDARSSVVDLTPRLTASEPGE